MRNYVQPGEVLTLTAPAGGVVTSTVYKIGSLIVVATVTADEDEKFAAMVGPCVISYAKPASQAWTEGVKVNWDDGAKNFTTGAGTLAGVAARAVGNGADETTGYIRLDGVAR